MTRAPIDDYLAQLQRALRNHGLDDPRAVEEAREHLVDAVADARRRGMTDDDAAGDAVDRFGAPGLVAAQMARAEDWTMNRLAALVWQRKWWILAPTMVAALVTSVYSYNFMPIRYRSDTSVSVMERLAPGQPAGQPAPDRPAVRLAELSQTVLSSERLERLIDEFDLYAVERRTLPIADVVQQMRGDIAVTYRNAERDRDGEVGGFNVSFVAAEPKVAMRITERLAALYVEANLLEREAHVEGTRQSVGTQFKIVDPAYLPNRPHGPSRLGVNVVGALAGLGLGVMLVLARQRSRRDAELTH